MKFDMKVTKEQIKAWLTSIGKDREWLAEQLKTTKSVVDSWFSSRGFPSDRLEAIMALMEPEESISLIRVPFTDEQLAATQKAARATGFENIQEYCQRAIEARVSQDLASKVESSNLRLNPEIIAFELPFYGYAAAGSPVVSQLIDETCAVSKKYPAGYFVIEVNGQSMEPTLPDGSRIVCEPKEYSPKHGKICIISDGHGSSVKRYDGKRKAFVSDNPDYPDFTPVDEVKLQGYFVEILPED